jgi:hypothetical protein
VARGRRARREPEAALASGWHAFREGFLAASPAATALTLAVAAGCWAALLALMTPARIAAGAPLLAEEPKDSYAFVTGRAHELSAAAPGRPLVVLTGASGMRYAVSGLDRMQAELGRHLDVEPLVFNLCTDDQTVLETLSLVQQVPDGSTCVLLLGMNPLRLHRGIAQADPDTDRPYVYRLGFRSPFVERAFADAGDPLPRPVAYVWDNRHFFLPRLGTFFDNLWNAPPPEFEPRVDEPGGRRVAQARWNDHKDIVTRSIVPIYAARSAVAFDAIATVAAGLAERARATVVLLEAPVAPTARRAMWGEEFYAGHLARVEAVARENGFRHWDLSEAAGLTDDDFFDWTHLNRGEARVRFTGALADRLEELLVETGAAARRP